ncbi:hydrogenase 3 maturation endopeptidase HyCI [Thermodesulfovibrio hydrogeniphilus]
MNLEDFLKNLKGKVLILSVGHPLREDDAVGSYVAEKIKGKIKADVINCGESPEKFTDKIVQLNPDVLIFIDAVEMNSEAGSIAFFSEDEVNSKILFTHKSSLGVLTKYIKAKIDCKVFLIAIQPMSTNFGHSLSEKVQKTADILSELLIEKLS